MHIPWSNRDPGWDIFFGTVSARTSTTADVGGHLCASECGQRLRRCWECLTPSTIRGAQGFNLREMQLSWDVLGVMIYLSISDGFVYECRIRWPPKYHFFDEENYDKPPNFETCPHEYDETWVPRKNSNLGTWVCFYRGTENGKAFGFGELYMYLVSDHARPFARLDVLWCG